MISERQQLINKGNKEIAFFMQEEREYFSCDKELKEYRFVRYQRIQERFDNGWSVDMRYHSSWDWLMPVIAVIRKNAKSQREKFKEFYGEGGLTVLKDLMKAVEDSLKKLDIEGVWTAVVEFIEWSKNPKLKNG